MVDDALQVIVLDDPVDFAGFRREARRLLSRGVPPEQIDWQVRGADDTSLFAATSADADADVDKAAADEPTPQVAAPRAFITLCERVVLHRDPSRFGLMYRLLWRFQREPALRHDVLDADRVQAEHLARTVRRDMHKMTAFVRFRRIAQGEGDDGELHVAWFEPDHHIVEATAPFFARRFTQMRWAILTPDRCVRWDGHTLTFSPGAQRDEAPAADAGEQLWLTYYQHIFNPARLKLAMMRKEMPVRYWKNLPEAALIAPLTAQAAERSGMMIERAPTDTRRRLAVSTIQAAPVDGDDDTPPASLAELAQAANRCRRCPIGALATQAVAGVGPAQASLMLVGEQPGDQEDLRGQPFVGPAGKLLDRAMAQLGWPRDAVYLTNAVKHFKYELRGKRRIHKTASQREAAICLHWLEEEIGLVAPAAIVALGATAARSLMGRAVGVTAERGRWLQRDDGLKVLITLHPSALLRVPDEERDAAFARWLDDLRLAAPHLPHVA